MRLLSGDLVPIRFWGVDVDDDTLRQARNLAKLSFAFRHIALMPDCHVGYGMPIGGVLASDGVVVPNAVGVDIGCGMRAARTSLSDIGTDALKEILAGVRRLVPTGFEHHRSSQTWDGFDRAPDLPVIQRELDSARRQLGTLGGGNHFIEVQKGDDGRIWLMIHSGSRNFGLKTANEYHGVAKGVCHRKGVDLPDPDLAHLAADSREGRDYLAAMNFCLDFARANRALMMDRLKGVVRDVTGASVDDELDIHHNYAAVERHFGRDLLVHRKGATLAREGTRGIIPGSMGTTSHIVRGLGSPDSFESCSHGAGRRMGRKEATRKLDLATEQAKMAGIVHGLRSRGDLDEAPGAYKEIGEVMASQEDLVKSVVRLSPLAVVKG